jgi:hypothetical protein
LNLHFELHDHFAPAFLAVLGFELKVPGLLRQPLYHLSHTSSPYFSFGYFLDRDSGFYLSWPWTSILPMYPWLLGLQTYPQFLGAGILLKQLKIHLFEEEIVLMYLKNSKCLCNIFSEIHGELLLKTTCLSVF